MRNIQGLRSYWTRSVAAYAISITVCGPRKRMCIGRAGSSAFMGCAIRPRWERREVQAFLSHLANERGVAVSTHKQALCALLFLYKQVLRMDLPWMAQLHRPTRQAR